MPPSQIHNSISRPRITPCKILMHRSAAELKRTRVYFRNSSNNNVFVVRNYIVFVVMAAAGSFRLKVECLIDGKKADYVHTGAPTDPISSVLEASVTKFGLNVSEWNLCKDEGRTDVLAPSSSLEFNGLKSGLKLWLGKVMARAAHLDLCMRASRSCVCRSAVRN